MWRGCCWSTGPFPNDSRISMTPVHSNLASVMLRVAALALTIFVFSGGDGNAQSRATQGSASNDGPFGQLAGSWSGSGTIDLSHGRHEPSKCRASYDVLEEQNKLQLNIHCASDSMISICAAARPTPPARSQAPGASRPAMPPEPCPARSKALAFRSSPRDRHSPPI